MVCEDWPRLKELAFDLEKCNRAEFITLSGSVLQGEVMCLPEAEASTQKVACLKLMPD